jgi:hypothetical protein
MDKRRNQLGDLIVYGSLVFIGVVVLGGLVVIAPAIGPQDSEDRTRSREMDYTVQQKSVARLPSEGGGQSRLPHVARF